MRGYPQFSLDISIALATICISSIVMNCAKNTSAPVGTVLKKPAILGPFQVAQNVCAVTKRGLKGILITFVKNGEITPSLQLEKNSTTTKGEKSIQFLKGISRDLL